MSLPLAFGTTLETIPAQTPYLSVPDQARRKAAALAWPTAGKRVGLTWAGKPTFSGDRYRYRSVPFALLEPLIAMDGLRLFSLQIGDGAQELAAAPGAVTDLSPFVDDMADTAAQIVNLDLVISADTSVAHLAGALGVPTLVLLPFTPDWRWLQTREDTPWYPNMRLIRQPEPGDWESVIQRACSLL